MHHKDCTMMRTRPRQQQARRGAILILVIVLLVLMAMMGIAYMATARVDRVGASQNVVNTQIDLLVEGARNMAQGLIVNDLFGDGGAYRPPSVNRTLGGYQHWDAPHNDSDPWLASRVPVPLSELAVPHGMGTYHQGDIVESSNSYYLCVASTSSIPPGGDWILLTESNGAPMQGNRPVWPYVTGISQTVFEDLTAFGPTTTRRELVFPIGYNLNGMMLPGMRIWPGQGVQLYDYVGADADGDGVADSLLFPLTLSEQDGVRYYAAIRIIDHNSALNVLTALQPQGGNRNHFFPSNINLVGMLGVDPDVYAAEVFKIDPSGFRNPPGRSDFEFRTLAEALWMIFGRRLEMAQLTSGLPPQTEGGLLAHRFVLSPRTGQGSMFDHFSAHRTEPYDLSLGSDADEWLAHFDYERAGGAVFHRPLLVTSNAVSNAIPVRSITVRPGPRGSQPRSWAHQLPGMADYDPHPVKVSINTADFGELWLAFWAAMVEDAATSSAPSWINPEGQAVTVPMFREVQRWQPEPVEEGDDPDAPRFRPTPENFRVLLRAAIAAVNAIDLRDPDQDITVREFTIGDWQFTVYGMEMQPFITEVVVYRAADANSEDDYVAIELFNPHSEAIDLRGWKLATVDRTLPQMDGEPDRAQPLVLTELADFSALGVTQIEAGQYLVLQSRESEDIAPIGGQVVEIPELYDVRGKELLVLRPRILGQEGQSPYDMVPIDQFDFTELHEENAGDLELPPQWYYYSRPTSNWQWVFPGRYTAHSDPNKVLDPIIPDGYIVLRYEDLEETSDPPAASLGGPNTDVTVSRRYEIQLNQPGWAGERDGYPFGGFARNGDILKVPFIGAYRVRDANMPAGQFWELNSVTMDAALADDPDRDQQAVGRFAPRFDPAIEYPEGDSYAWAEDLLDYLTVQAPNNDYLPEADPATYTPRPAPVFSSPASQQANDRRHENLVGVQGLININTAPWRVLATLPFVPNDTQDANGNGVPDKAEAIAKAIVADRRVNGPYRTLFDLMRVPEFREPAGLAADATWGDFDGANDPADDFERRYMMLTRISNLVTTRSDTFTVYILVQGWRGTGTPNPVLTAERRAAFIIDRNSVQQWDQSLILRNVPQE